MTGERLSDGVREPAGFAAQVMERLVTWHPDWAIDLRTMQEDHGCGVTTIIANVQEPGKPNWGTAVAVTAAQLARSVRLDAVVQHVAERICQYGHPGWSPAHAAGR